MVAFLRRIYDFDWRPEYLETICSRIKLVAAGLQSSKDELAIAGGFHGFDIFSVFNDLHRCGRNRRGALINKLSAHASNWL